VKTLLLTSHPLSTQALSICHTAEATAVVVVVDTAAAAAAVEVAAMVEAMETQMAMVVADLTSKYMNLTALEENTFTCAALMPL